MGSNQEAFDWMCQQMRKMRAEMEEMREEMELLKINIPVSKSDPEEGATLREKKVRVVIPSDSLFNDIVGKHMISGAMNSLFNLFRQNKIGNTSVKISAAHSDVYQVNDDTDPDIIVLVAIRVVVHSMEEYVFPPVMPRLVNSDMSWYKGNAKVIIWSIAMVAESFSSFGFPWNKDVHRLLLTPQDVKTLYGGCHYELKQDDNVTAMEDQFKKILN